MTFLPRLRTALCWALAGAALVGVGSLAAQRVPIRRLGPPLAVLSHEFSLVNSLRELSGDRVLVTDFIDNVVLLADLGADRVTPFGRIGDGPGEYRQVFPLLPMGRDTTLMGNAIARRWLMITRDTTLRTLAPGTDLTRKLQDVAALLGFDERGNMLGIRMRPRTTADDVELPIHTVLVSLRGSQEDTIDTRTKAFRRLGSPSDPPVAYVLTTDDEAVIAPDGWIALVRHAPYRVDWRAPDGRTSRGRAVDEPAVPVDEREKASYRARLASQTTPLTRRRPGTASGSSTPPRGTTIWPDIIPPFDGVGAVLPARGGRILVRRTPTASRPEPRYDLFSATRGREFQLVLAPNQRIQATGTRGLYVVTTDDDGIERISVHPWPTP
ncbi:MAG: hypothetical protein R3B35_13610 [Gemmatimonadales bacterium]